MKNSKLTIYVAIIIASVFFGSASIVEDKPKYLGYKLLHLLPNTEKQINLIAQFELDDDFDLWSRIKGSQGATVALSPEAFLKYQKIFKKIGLKYKILRHNLQDLIDEDQRGKITSRRQASTFFSAYRNHGEINKFIDDTVSQNFGHAQLKIGSYIAGKTYEGREMKVITIGTVSSTTATSRKVWIDCGIHAREWISPSTCTWIIDKLISEYKNNVASTVGTLNYYEFHILPVLNPDGYDYSFANSNNRLWRKNRSPNSGSTCIGTDLNRNFPSQWGTGGSSSLPCSDTYKGISAGSEIETIAVIQALERHKGRWDSYLTIHAFGKWWFTTYGYTTLLPIDFNELNATAKIGIDAIMATNNENGWTCGSSAQMLYIASGGSEDTAYLRLGIKHSYCLELRPANGTPNGFVIDETNIPLAGEESYRGIMAALRQIKG